MEDTVEQDDVMDASPAKKILVTRADEDCRESEKMKNGPVRHMN